MYTTEPDVATITLPRWMANRDSVYSVTRRRRVECGRATRVSPILWIKQGTNSSTKSDALHNPKRGGGQKHGPPLNDSLYVKSPPRDERNRGTDSLSHSILRPVHLHSLGKYNMHSLISERTILRSNSERKVGSDWSVDGSPWETYAQWEV